MIRLAESENRLVAKGIFNAGKGSEGTKFNLHKKWASISRSDLIRLLLQTGNGGTIIFAHVDGNTEHGSKLEVRKNGYTSKGARNPPPIEDTQEQLIKMLDLD